MIKQYTGKLLFLGDSLRHYSTELNYEEDDTFYLKEIITYGKSKYRIEYFELDPELGMTAGCFYIDEEA